MVEKNILEDISASRTAMQDLVSGAYKAAQRLEDIDGIFERIEEVVAAAQRGPLKSYLDRGKLAVALEHLEVLGNDGQPANIQAFYESTVKPFLNKHSEALKQMTVEQAGVERMPGDYAETVGKAINRTGSRAQGA